MSASAHVPVMYRKAPGTLWTPEKKTLQLSTGPIEFERDRYDGCTFPTLGDKVASFSKAFCSPSKGVHTGKPLEFRSYQQEVIDAVFRLNDEGKRAVTTAIVKAPRKYGKSQIAVPIALWFLLMEVSDGAPEVYSVAKNTAQASLVFNEVRNTVMRSEALSKRIKVYRRTLEVIKGPTAGGIYKALPADSGGAMGLSPTCTIADETAEWPNSEMWYAMALASGARMNPLLLSISTPGWDRGSLYYGLCDYGVRTATGEQDDDAFYYKAFEPLEEDADWRNPMVWLQANPGLGDYQSLRQFENNVKVTPESEFRRFHLAQWTNSSNAWIRSADWDACADPEATIEHGEDVVLVIDGSWSSDSTACVVATADGRVAIAKKKDGTLAIWEKPPNADESWRISHKEIEYALFELADCYRVQQFVFDKYGVSQIMESLQEARFEVLEFSFGNVDVMVRASRRFEVGVMTKQLRHSGEPTLTRHVMNCTPKQDAKGIRPKKSSDSAKIDAAVCAIAGFAICTARAEPTLAAPLPAVASLPWS